MNIQQLFLIGVLGLVACDSKESKDKDSKTTTSSSTNTQSNSSSSSGSGDGSGSSGGSGSGDGSGSGSAEPITAKSICDKGFKKFTNGAVDFDPASDFRKADQCYERLAKIPGHLKGSNFKAEEFFADVDNCLNEKTPDTAQGCFDKIVNKWESRQEEIERSKTSMNGDDSDDDMGVDLGDDVGERGSINAAGFDKEDISPRGMAPDARQFGGPGSKAGYQGYGKTAMPGSKAGYKRYGKGEMPGASKTSYKRYEKGAMPAGKTSFKQYRKGDFRSLSPAKK